MNEYLFDFEFFKYFLVCLKSENSYTSKGEFNIKNKPTVFILGTSHLAKPANGDLFMAEIKNVQTEKRQQEMMELIEALKVFKPTTVALEILKKNEVQVNNEYQHYLNNQFQLTASEQHQIGFRLAKSMELERIAAIDWNEAIDGIPNIGEWVADHPSEFFDEVVEAEQQVTAEAETYFQNHTIKEYLLWINLPDNVRRNQESYMKLSLIGDSMNPVGAKWTAHYWYFRNMLIYRNILRLATSADKRILVLYGAGHLHLLIQFLRESGLVDVEVASDYLMEK